MNKIVRASYILEKAVTITIIFLLFLTMYSIILAFWPSVSSYPYSENYSDLSIAPPLSVLTQNNLVPLLVLNVCVMQIFFLWQLKRLFDNYKKRKIFNNENSSYIRKSSMAFLTIVLSTLLIESLLNTSLTVNNLSGTQFIWGDIDIIQLSNIFIGIVLFILAWIMEEARRLQEEIDRVI